MVNFILHLHPEVDGFGKQNYYSDLGHLTWRICSDANQSAVIPDWNLHI